jgi:hypothetical protein
MKEQREGRKDTRNDEEMGGWMDGLEAMIGAEIK